MGFRFKRFDYIGGRSPWTSGSTSSVREQNSRVVCKDFADFLISCGKGWELDTTRNATTSSFVNVPMKNGSGTAQSFVGAGLFFRNTISGCKLFLCAAGFQHAYGINLSNDSLLLDVPISTNAIHGGIILSMIPGGSQSEFGSSFDNSFLPSDATYLAGTSWAVSGYASNYDPTYIGYNDYGSSHYNFTYCLFVDSYCVGVGGGYTTNGTSPSCSLGLVCGRIIGTLAHENDTLPQAKYGVLRLRDSAGNASDMDEFYYKRVSSLGGIENFGGYFSQPITTLTTQAEITAKCNGMIFAADGARIDGRNQSNVRFYPHTGSGVSCNPLMCNATQSGLTRWCPYEIGVVSASLSTDGVIPGDGFKGYLDTTLFRCAKVNFNQLYDNGNFIGANANSNLMIGWDPNNTDSL